MTSKALTRLLYILSKKHKDPDKIVDQFLKFAEGKHILYKVPAIIKRLEHMAKLKRHETTVKLRVPREISKSTEKKIKEFMGVSEEIETEQIVDGTLTGGFIAEYDNMVYDGSIERQLSRLRETLIRD